MRLETTTERCLVCRIEKTYDEFNRDARRKGGLFPYCKECRRVLRRTRYREDRAYSHERAVRKNYGLTANDYGAMLEAQGGTCAICGVSASDIVYKSKRLQVDHCHASGKVRGLLCAGCNRGLGSFKDDPELLRSAMKYLRRYA